MLSLLKNRRVLIFLFLVMIATFSVLLYANINSIIKHSGTIFAAGGILVGILGWIKDRPKVFMFFAQCKALVFSGQTRWNLSAHYVIDDRKVVNFPHIKEHIKKIGNNRHIFQETNHSLKLSVDGLNLHVSIQYADIFEDSENSELHVQIFEYHAPYHETVDLIKNVFVPLFEDLEQSFQVHKRRYAATMLFGKKNPFYGLYFKHLELNKILDFHCVIEENRNVNGENDKCIVKVSKDRLDFSSVSLNQLRNSAEKYLAVSWG